MQVASGGRGAWGAAAVAEASSLTPGKTQDVLFQIKLDHHLSHISRQISALYLASGHTIALVWCTPGPHVDRPLVLVNTYFRTCCSKGAALRASRARRARQHYRDFTKKKPSLSVRRRYKSCLVGSDRWQCHYFSFCMRAWHMQMVHPRDQGYISQLLNCQR